MQNHSSSLVQETLEISFHQRLHFPACRRWGPEEGKTWPGPWGQRWVKPRPGPQDCPLKTPVRLSWISVKSSTALGVASENKTPAFSFVFAICFCSQVSAIGFTEFRANTQDRLVASKSGSDWASLSLSLWNIRIHFSLFALIFFLHIHY